MQKKPNSLMNSDSSVQFSQQAEKEKKLNSEQSEVSV